MSGIQEAAMAAGGGLAAPITNTYTDLAGTETVPTGAVNVVIELWGGGGGGQGGAGACTGRDGDGGGSGAYCRSSYACSGGQTLSYSAWHGGAKGSFPGGSGVNGAQSTCTSGTLAITAMTAFGGGAGDGTGGGGAGTLATGGNDLNSGGNPGGDGLVNPAGGAAIVGVNGAGGGKGGNGGTAGVSTSGSGGNAGRVIFYYT